MAQDGGDPATGHVLRHRRWQRVGWPLLREIGNASLPALAALLVLQLLGAAELWALAIALLAALVTAAVVTRLWLQELRAAGNWIDSLIDAEPGQRPLIAGDLLADHVVRPVLHLARTYRREHRLVATQRRQLEQMVEALPDPVMLVDARRVTSHANAAARRSFGFDGGLVPLDTVTRDPGLLAAVEAAIVAREASNISFSPSHRIDRSYAARIEPVALPAGGTGAMITLREESDQLMIERMRSGFVADASHEIRTPLTSLLGIIETLRGPAKDDPAAREMFLETMEEEATRMKRLVEDLLSLSSIELAAMQQPSTPCDLGEIVDEVIESRRHVAARARVRLVHEPAADLPPILGDPDQLHQLAANLVDNAIKYGGEDKEVLIETVPLATAGPSAGPLAGRPSVTLAVTDHGPGIAREHLPRLTERFYRVDKARSRRLGGTGLGLAICKHIVRRHRGHLEIRSELGKGSTFRVFFPLARED